MDGEGQYYFKDQTSYQGSFNDGLQHGQGRIIKNGKEAFGYWK